MNSKKRAISVMLAIVLALSLLLAACGKSGDSASGGTYDGEYDTDGKKSGYGVWIYDNFRYEGYFENDMPNGEGTLYETSIPPADKDPSKTYVSKIVVRGNWVNGFSDGLITLSWFMESGETHTWTLDTANGYPTQDGTVYTAEGRNNLDFTKTWMVGGVPPWADVQTDPSVAPPSGGDAPETALPGTPDEFTPSPDVSVPEAVTPEERMVSTAGTYYASGQFIYMLPEGVTYYGSQRNEERKATTENWIKDYGTDTEIRIGIMDYDDDLTDYDTRTDEQWYEFIMHSPIDPSAMKELKTEKTSVDGYRAVRLTFAIYEEGYDDSAYMEVWAIDAPGGYVALWPINSEIWSDYDLHSQWVAEIIGSIRFK